MYIMGMTDERVREEMPHCELCNKWTSPDDNLLPFNHENIRRGNLQDVGKNIFVQFKNDAII